MVETAPAIAQTSSAATTPTFTRSLGAFGVIILTLSVLSPGVSVFVTGASILQTAGTGAIFAFLLGGLVNYCQTSMSAELGAAYPTAGYDYAAVGHAIGDWAGATTYIASIFSIPLFLNISALGIAIYLRPVLPDLDNNLATLLTVGVVTTLALLNIRSNERITGLFMVIELGALLVVAGLGLFHLQSGIHAMVFHPVHIENGVWAIAGLIVLGLATNSASWAVAGSSQALMFCEDMRRPETIGRIIMLSFLITVVTETAPVIGAIVGAHDLKAVLGSSAPFETFLRQYLPETGMKLMSLSIAIAIFNACLAGFIGIGRNVFAMGRTQLFTPSINHALTRLIPKTDAPWVAVLAIGVTTALATFLSLKFKILLLSGGFTMLTCFYIWGIFAGRRSGRTGTHAYRTPYYPLIPILGVLIVIGEVIVLWSDPDSGRPSLFICSGFYVIGYLYYRIVLVRRPEGWKMTGPADVDAMTR
jgi:amino acid transporter